MPEHVAHGGFTRGRNQLHLRAIARRIDFEVFELGNVFVQRVVELEFSFFEQHQESHARDRLGHRIHAKEAVGLHRLVLFDVRHAIGIEVHDLAVTRYQRDNAGRAALVHVGMGLGIEACETARREAFAFSRDCRNLLAQGHGGQRDEPGREQYRPEAPHAANNTHLHSHHAPQFPGSRTRTHTAVRRIVILGRLLV